MEIVKLIAEAIVPIVAIIATFSPFVIWIWANHQKKMREYDIEMMNIEMKNKSSSGATVNAVISNAEVESLRQELRALKDTTMQYDLSFDTALQTMEKRIQTLEIDRRAAATENWAQMRNGQSGD